MEKKKNKKADLENKKGLFLQIGLVMALAGVLTAFEWRTYDSDNPLDLGRVTENFDEDLIIQTVQPPPPPPPPPQDIIIEIEVVSNQADVDNVDIGSVDVDPMTAMPSYTPPALPEDPIDDGEEVYPIVEEQPEFPGGEQARMAFLRDNIRYPHLAREAGIQGMVFITFVVERDGSISNVQVLRGIGGGCDEEAVRVVRMMPRWTPGKQLGRPVRVQFSMSIRFTLAN